MNFQKILTPRCVDKFIQEFFLPLIDFHRWNRYVPSNKRKYERSAHFKELVEQEKGNTYLLSCVILIFEKLSCRVSPKRILIIANIFFFTVAHHEFVQERA